MNDLLTIIHNHFNSLNQAAARPALRDSPVQRPRVIRIAATLVAGAPIFAPVPAAAQLFPGELRPSVEGADSAQPGQSGGQTSTGIGSGLLSGPSLYGAPESGAGRFGFVSVGDRKLKVRVRPGYTPPGTVPIAGRATLRVAPAQLGTTAVRPPSRLKRRGFLLDPSRAVELQRPLNLPPNFVVEPPIVPLRQSVIDLNPFGPTGIHAGTFYLQPAIELTGGWDSNPQHATEAKSAPEYLFSPELTVRSDWERHTLNFDIHGAYLGYGSTFFPNSPVWLNRPSLDSRVNARVDVDTHDHFDVEGRLLIATDNPGSPNIQAGLETLPIVLTGGATLGYTHVFNRFEVTAKGTIDRSIWQRSFLTDGTYSSNDDRNFRPPDLIDFSMTPNRRLSAVRCQETEFRWC
jgi:Putative beta-barrel porin 2